MIFKKYSWQLLVVLSSLALVTIWFRGKNLLGAAESALPFYDLQIEYEMTRWAWSSPGAGNSAGMITASFPTYWFLAQIQNVGVPGYIIEAGLFWFILLVSGLSVGYLTKELFPKMPQKFIILCIAFYWFNPFVLVNVWNRFLYNHMFFWALIPLAWLLFLKGIRLKDIRFSIYVALVSVVFSYALTSPAFVILLWLLFSHTILFRFLFKENNRVFLIKYFFSNLIFFIIFNLWWLSQTLSFAGTSSYEAAISRYFSSIGNLSTLSSISKSLGKLTDLVRLLHADFIHTGPSWARYYDIFTVRGIQFFAAGSIFWAILKFKKNKEILYLGSLFVISLFLTKGVQGPFGEIFQSVFQKSTIFQVFRNPFEKFGFLLPLSSSLLFTFAIWKISYSRSQEYPDLIGDELSSDMSSSFRENPALLAWGGRHKAKYTFIYYLSLVFLIVIWGFPFWTGLIFTNIKYFGSKELTNYEVRVPSYYENANNFIKETVKDSRFIALPIGDEGITHNWEKSYRGVELTSSLFTTPGISLKTTIPFYNDLASEISVNQLAGNVINIAPYANASHILLRNDIDYKERQMSNPSSVEKVLNGLVEEGHLQKKFNEGNISIYEVSKNYSWPKIYSTKNLLLTNNAKVPEITSFSGNFPAEKNAFLYSSSRNDNITFRKSIFFPNNTFFQKVTTPIPKDLTDEDLLSRLFYVKHLPGSFFYPLARIKEKLLEGSQDDYFGRIIYKTGVLDKRAVEIYKLKKEGKNGKIILMAESNFEKEFKNIKSEFTQLISGHTSVESLIKMSLLYQWILLDRVDSDAAHYISEFLTIWGIKPRFELPVSESKYVIFGFKLPESGSYDVDMSGIYVSPLYLDGNLLSEQKPYLEKGEHEVAFFVKDNLIPTDVLEEKEFMISSSADNGWNIKIPPTPTSFMVSFDYRFVEGDSFEVNFFQDIDRENSPILSGGIRKEKMYHGWKRMEKNFTTTPGATNGILKISPTEIVVCKRNLLLVEECSEKKSSFEIQIRNLNVSHVVLPSVTLITENGLFDDTETQIEWKKINPTFYKARVQKKDNENEMIVFSELYNSGWKAVLDDKDWIQEDKHFMVNGYANGWLVDKQGSYEIDIKFAPEDYFKKTKKISVISIVLAIIFLIGLEGKKKKK